MLSFVTGIMATALVMTHVVIPPPSFFIEAVEAPVEQVAELPEEEKILNLINSTFGEDAPIMIKISRCESGLRQTKPNGEVIVSPTKDYGLFQINLASHKETLEEMKLDHNKLEDNIKYAKYLFDAQGTAPWFMSKHCWSQ